MNVVFSVRSMFTVLFYFVLFCFCPFRVLSVPLSLISVLVRCQDSGLLHQEAGQGFSHRASPPNVETSSPSEDSLYVDFPFELQFLPEKAAAFRCRFGKVLKSLGFFISLARDPLKLRAFYTGNNLRGIVEEASCPLKPSTHPEFFSPPKCLTLTPC